MLGDLDGCVVLAEEIVEGDGFGAVRTQSADPMRAHGRWQSG